MEEKKVPKAFRVDWSVYSLLTKTPLSEFGISPRFIGTSVNPTQDQFSQLDTVISSGAPHIQVSTFQKEIPPFQADIMRDLAKVNKVEVSLHGPTGIDFSLMPESFVRDEMLKHLDTAVRLLVSPKEFEKNPEKAREKAKKALVNVHLGTIGTIPLYEPTVHEKLPGIKEYSPTYVLAGRGPGNTYEFQGRIYGDEVLDRIPHKKSEIIEKLNKLREKYDSGEITGEEYVKEKEKVLDEINKLSKLAAQMHFESLINESYARLEQARRMIGDIMPDIISLLDEIEKEEARGNKDRAELLKQKLLQEIFRRTDIVGQRADLMRLFDFYLSALSQIERLRGLKRDPDKTLTEEELKKELEELYRPFLDELTKDPEKYGIPKIFAEKGLKGIYELKKKILNKLGIALGSEINIMSLKEFVSENAARKLAKALADFFEKKGTIPTFVIENGIPPYAEADIDVIIDTAKKLRKYFVEEVMKRKKRLEKKGIKISKKEVEKLAEEQIGITIDTSHLWMWKAHGKTEEEIMRDLKKAIDSGLIKHFHAVDALPGFGHHHLVPGQGTLDWKEIMKIVKKAREEGKIPEDLIFLLEPGQTVEYLAAMGHPDYQKLRVGYTYVMGSYGGMLVEPETYLTPGIYPMEVSYFPVGEEVVYFPSWWEVKKKGGG